MDVRNIALLIDAENVSKKYIKLIFDELSEFGVPTYKLVFGDVSNPSVTSWKDVMQEYALTPKFQINYTSGKSASDTALIIEAMDILYSGNVQGFCIVSSDSDFTKLINRLRESGMLVIGMGEEKSPESLVAACEKFKYLDLLYNEEAEKEAEVEEKARAAKNREQAKASGIPKLKVIRKEIERITDQYSDDEGWVDLSEIGGRLGRKFPGFDSRNYQFSKLIKLIESFDIFEKKTVENPKNKQAKIVLIRNKKR